MTTVDGRGVVARTALRWVQRDGGFAQVITLNAAGFPVTRTVGAILNDDWTVDLIQRRVHRRLDQLRRNPRLEVIWVGSPAPGSHNDHPAVFDFGRLVPRAVMVRGTAEFMDEEWTLWRYREESARLRARGFTKAPERDDADVRDQLVGVHVLPVRIRAEGFGDGAESFTWTIEELR